MNPSSGLLKHGRERAEAPLVTVAVAADEYETGARTAADAGDHTGALALAQHGERLADARGEHLAAAWCRLLQARALAALADARCVPVARAAVRGFDDEGCAVGAAQALAVVAHRLAVTGGDGVVDELAHAAVALEGVTPAVEAIEAYADLAEAEAATGLLDRADDHARLAVRLAGELPVPETVALRAIAVLGTIVRQRVVTARHTIDEADARALAFDWLAAWPRLEARLRREPARWAELAVTAATLLVEVGDELVRALGVLTAVRRRAGDRPDIVVTALGELARVNLLTNHLDAAHAFLDEAEQRAVAARLHDALAGLAATRAAVFEAAGDADAALQAFKRYHQHTVASAERVRHRQSDAVRARVAELVQQSMVSALTNEANSDALTGLRNRRFLDHEAPALVDARRRRDEPTCVAVIDVDKFKHVNDHYGHAAGDEVLIAIGGLLRAGVRDDDLVIRTGGDEFVLVLGAPLAQTQRVLERVRASVEQADWVALGLPAVTLTIGAAALGAAQSLSDAIADADGALLVAKRAGRNAVHSAATP